MKMRIIGLALTVAALLVARGLWAEDKPAESMGKCPVSGHPGSKDHAADFEGGKIYFCCDNCPKAYAANPQKFTAKAHLQQVETGQLKQVACPFTGKPVDEKQTIDVDGVKVGVCCGNCKKAAEGMSKEKLVEKVFGDVSKSYKKAG